jgi:hypothetical protein
MGKVIILNKIKIKIKILLEHVINIFVVHSISSEDLQKNALFIK